VIAAVFIAALSVAVTFLATVHWLPLGGDEPAMVARRGPSARLPSSEPDNDQIPDPPAERRSEPQPRRTPIWAHTQPLDYGEAA